jgi:hypothetical protein
VACCVSPAEPAWARFLLVLYKTSGKFNNTILHAILVRIA